MTPRSVTKRLLPILVLLFLFLFLVFFLLPFGPSIQPAEGGSYRGFLPGFGQVQFNLFITPDLTNAWLYREGHGFDYDVQIEPRSPDSFHAELSEHHGSNSVAADFEFAEGRQQLIGTVNLTNSPPQSFQLARAFEHRAIHQRVRGTLKRLGAASSYAGQFPHLPPTNSFNIAMNRELLANCRLSCAAHSKFDMERVRLALHDDLGVEETHLDEQAQLCLLTDSIVSFAVWMYPETGVNGNPIRWRTSSYCSEFGSLHEFTLTNLFRPNSDWVTALHELCSQNFADRDLTNQAAELGDNRADLSLFTLDSQGVQIIFNPYRIAAGYEGFFTVHIPYSKLLPYLDTNGPARFLPIRQP